MFLHQVFVLASRNQRCVRPELVLSFSEVLMYCGVSLGEEGQAVLSVFLILIPAALYIMGLMEGRAGTYLFLGGLAAHAVSIAVRGTMVGTLPLTEKYDNISFMAFAMALCYWYYSKRKGIEGLTLLALPLISAVLIISVLYTPLNTISPFQRTPWFYLHIFFFFAGYAFFGVSSCIGLISLLRRGKAYEPVQYRAAMQGWVLLSLSLVAGSIWFFTAYGTYWLWTSKELWTTLTWFYYSMYLHGRYVKGISGTPASVLGILGFGVALFAYFGVGTVIPAPPTQF